MRRCAAEINNLNFSLGKFSMEVCVPDEFLMMGGTLEHGMLPLDIKLFNLKVLIFAQVPINHGW
jgi:hypothetical protein